jgi:tripartite-type tricarboxylate transporter receptor subunit TctC
LPDVPTIASQLPGFDVKSWIGVALPAGAPPEVVAKLNESLRKAVSDPAFRGRLELLGVRAESSTPDAMKTFVGLPDQALERGS